MKYLFKKFSSIPIAALAINQITNKVILDEDLKKKNHFLFGKIMIPHPDKKAKGIKKIK